MPLRPETYQRNNENTQIPIQKSLTTFMVVKNMDIWAISGNNNTSHLYNNSNQVIIQYKKVEKNTTVPLKRIIKRNTAYPYIHHYTISKSIKMSISRSSFLVLNWVQSTVENSPRGWYSPIENYQKRGTNIYLYIVLKEWVFWYIKIVYSMPPIYNWKNQRFFA